MMKKGILLQGPVTEWTADIVNEYKENFEDTAILLSTWTNENVDNITCDCIQIELPEPTYPHNSTINYQILGAKRGINKIDADVILKTKTNQFIHNNQIFDIFEKNRSAELTTSVGTLGFWEASPQRTASTSTILEIGYPPIESPVAETATCKSNYKSTYFISTPQFDNTETLGDGAPG